jgi:hypothetical protein
MNLFRIAAYVLTDLAGDAWRGPATPAFGSPQSGWAPQ